MASRRGVGVATEVALNITQCLMPCTYMEYKVCSAIQCRFALPLSLNIFFVDVNVKGGWGRSDWWPGSDSASNVYFSRINNIANASHF